MSKSAIFSVKLFIPALLKSPAKSITALGVQIKNAVHFLFFTPLNLRHGLSFPRVVLNGYDARMFYALGEGSPRA